MRAFFQYSANIDGGLKKLKKEFQKLRGGYRRRSFLLSLVI